jgi:hypothetical protein
MMPLVQECMRELCEQHAPFYLGAEDVPGSMSSNELLTHFQKLDLTSEEHAVSHETFAWCMHTCTSVFLGGFVVIFLAIALN